MIVVALLVGGAMLSTWWHERRDASLERSLDRHDGQLREASGRLDVHETRLGKTETAVQAEQATNERQVVEIAVLEKRCQALETQVGELTTRATDLARVLEAAQSRLYTLESETLERLRAGLVELEQHAQRAREERDAVRLQLEELLDGQRNTEDRLRRIEDALELTPAP